MKYAELHARSAFSFLRGASLPEELARSAAELEIPALAVCDRDGVYGSARLTTTAKECGVKPIVGCELTMEDGSILPVLVENRTGYHHLCALLSRAHLRAAKGEARISWEELPEFAEGLIALSGDHEGPLQRALRHPERSVTESKDPAKGILRALPKRGQQSHLRPSDPHIRANPAPSSELSSSPLAGSFDCVPLRSTPLRMTPGLVLEKLLRIFGHANVFVELQRHLLRGENRTIRQLVGLAAAHRLPILATNGPCHVATAGRQVLDVFTCLRNHTHLDLAGTLLSQNAERRLKSPEQMAALFHDLPEAIENTVRLAERCEFRLENLGYEFPTYPTPDGSSQEAFLRRATFDGARRRYGASIPEKVTRQLEHELQLINKLGFAGYFLIVWDIANFCREENIMMQGRGSAANSAVCFCLGITAVDAVKHELLFERFLSEGRKSWPDIDLDLPSGARRERVIQEVYRRYGRDGAAMTANVITYRGRSAAREIGKALNFPTDLSNRFSALFAAGDFPHTLELQEQMKAAGIPLDHPRTPAFVSLYAAMRGLPRHLGQHSGGMILCPGKLHMLVPLENASMPGRSVAQWDKDDCEDLGIIKVDLLGLGMMAALQDTVELCVDRGRLWKEGCPKVDPQISQIGADQEEKGGAAGGNLRDSAQSADSSDLLATIPQDDSATYDLMCRADTIGVFQIESRAQMATLPRMKPRCFYDVAIEVAIIRPGPIQGGLMHPYLRRRAGVDPIEYIDERLEPVLRRTLGVPLFQEQILQIAMVMADFTGSEAEELRRAVSFHRSHERMAKVVVKLEQKMTEKGVSAEKQERIIASIQSFALYGFPESHAISFALLAYASSWLKVHRAPEFFASLLNNQPMGFYSPATLVRDAKHHGVQIRPVCVRRSEWRCTVGSDDSIRLGLCVVRGLRREHAEVLLAERGQRPFASIEDFKARAGLNKEELRMLAEIGALNALAAHRREALWQAEETMLPADDLFASSAGEELGGARDPRAVFGDSPKTPEDAPTQTNTHPTTDRRDADQSTRVACSTQSPAASPLPPMSPIERLQADYRGTSVTTGPHPMALVRERFPELWRACDLPQAPNGACVQIGGSVICRQRPGTAKGFVFISVEDETGVANAVVEPEFFEVHRLTLTHELFLLIEGRLQNVDGVIHIRGERVAPLLSAPLASAGSHDFH